MIFKENSAILAGNSIYVSPLYKCQQLYLKEVNSSDLYSKRFTSKERTPMIMEKYHQ